jgi:outer membrane biosynthesis protein TonB
LSFLARRAERSELTKKVSHGGPGFKNTLSQDLLDHWAKVGKRKLTTESTHWLEEFHQALKVFATPIRSNNPNDDEQQKVQADKKVNDKQPEKPQPEKPRPQKPQPESQEKQQPKHTKAETIAEEDDDDVTLSAPKSAKRVRETLGDDVEEKVVRVLKKPTGKPVKLTRIALPACAPGQSGLAVLSSLSGLSGPLSMTRSRK